MAVGSNENPRTAPTGPIGLFLLWPLLAGLTLAAATGAVILRITGGARYDNLLLLAAAASAVVLAFRLPPRPRPQAKSAPDAENHLPLTLLDSAGPAVLAFALDGRLLYMNPAAERLLGCHAAEFDSGQGAAGILAHGEGARLLAEVQKLSGLENPQQPTPAGLMAAYLECVTALPPSMVPSFDARLRRKDGGAVPATLHISALRDGAGAATGLVFVALDQSATLRHEQALRESQERYRDLFEHSSEMIATLSPIGKILYANPALKRCFGKESFELPEVSSFDELFSSSCRHEVSSLFRRALEGEQVDRAPLRHHTEDGRVLELELSLSQRQRAGNPLAIRCLMRDVTQQKQREHRLALQLVVSQIVGENASSDLAGMRILEALCVSQGWDMAVKWAVNEEERRLEFGAAWAAPGRRAEIFIQESMGLNLAKGVDLPGRAWLEGRPVWISDLASEPSSARIETALNHEMVSGWAVPVLISRCQPIS